VIGLVILVVLVAIFLLLAAWHHARGRALWAEARADRLAADLDQKTAALHEAVGHLARLRTANTALIIEADLRGAVESALRRRLVDRIVLTAAEIETLRVFAGYLTMRLAEDAPDAPYRAHKEAVLLIVKRMTGEPS
jgi:hypothetical protein